MGQSFRRRLAGRLQQSKERRAAARLLSQVIQVATIWELEWSESTSEQAGEPLCCLAAGIVGIEDAVDDASAG
jgi:hypothetical protein